MDYCERSNRYDADGLRSGRCFLLRMHRKGLSSMLKEMLSSLCRELDSCEVKGSESTQKLPDAHTTLKGFKAECCEIADTLDCKTLVIIPAAPSSTCCCLNAALGSLRFIFLRQNPVF